MTVLLLHVNKWRWKPTRFEYNLWGDSTEDRRIFQGHKGKTELPFFCNFSQMHGRARTQINKNILQAKTYA
jgi:hypothetical protein